MRVHIVETGVVRRTAKEIKISYDDPRFRIVLLMVPRRLDPVLLEDLINETFEEEGHADSSL